MTYTFHLLDESSIVISQAIRKDSITSTVYKYGDMCFQVLSGIFNKCRDLKWNALWEMYYFQV